jgi:hypothetical protein
MNFNSFSEILGMLFIFFPIFFSGVLGIFHGVREIMFK